MQQNKKRIKIKESNNYGLDRISMIAEFDGNEEELFKLDFGNVLPVLPLRNMVLFPTAVLPVSVGREASLQLIHEMQEKKGYFAVVCQKDHRVEEPIYKDIYPTGTIAKVIKIFEMPDGHVTALLQGMQRVRVKRFTRTAPYIRGHSKSTQPRPTARRNVLPSSRNCRSSRHRMQLSTRREFARRSWMHDEKSESEKAHHSQYSVCVHCTSGDKARTGRKACTGL